MTCYTMHRSFADFMGLKWPKELACIVNGDRITWAQLKAERVKRQRARMCSIDRMNINPIRHAAYVWVFYQPGLFGFAYQGYWLAIRTLNHTWTLGFKGGCSIGIGIVDIMKMFPCGFLPLIENYEKWKKEFIRQYYRPGRFKKQGMVPVWVESGHEGKWPDKIYRINTNGLCR